MLSTKLFSNVVDEALTLSASSPTITSLLRAELIAYYADAVIFASDNYPDTINVLYAIDDNQMYSIVSLSYEDEYSFFLIPADGVAPRPVMKNVINRIKTEFDLEGRELGEEIRKVQALNAVLHQILVSSTRTTRKAIHSIPKEIILPPVEEMQRYYECGRKTQYDTREEAESHISGENQSYRCNHCNLYHQGKEPTGQSIPTEIMHGRWQTAWRRYHNV